MARSFAEIAFTPTVRAVQKRMGSASAYAKLLEPMAARGDRLGPEEAAFLAACDGFYQATVSSSGWPYVQFRGGSAGFLKVLDEQTIGYADFRGNRQYLSHGNLSDDDRVSLILMDYAARRRLKIWGRANLIDAGDDHSLIGRLHDPTYRARVEHAVLIRLEAFDWNCPSHIPQRLTPEQLEPTISALRSEIARLEAESRQLRASLANLPERRASDGSASCGP